MIASASLYLYPFFGFLNSDQLMDLAALSLEESFDSGIFIFKEGETAEWFYILTKGGVDLLFLLDLHNYPPQYKELLFASINPGEFFGISALLEPNVFTSSARTSKPSKVIKIQSSVLLDLCSKDDKLSYSLYRQVAKAAMDRLNTTRLQLATARVSVVTSHKEKTP
jgi:CRP/FNR family transcriptional regulator, cyclic AMP receptor protein